MNGQSLALGTGDTINIGGTRGDGSAVARTFTVGSSSTVQDLLNAINDSTSGFGATSRTATAALNGGQIAITDGTSGDSQLAMSLSVTRSQRRHGQPRLVRDGQWRNRRPQPRTDRRSRRAVQDRRPDAHARLELRHGRDCRRDAEPPQRRAGNDRQPAQSRATPPGSSRRSTASSPPTTRCRASSRPIRRTEAARHAQLHQRADDRRGAARERHVHQLDGLLDHHPR